MDTFPSSPALQQALALAVVTGDSAFLGAGTPDDPLVATSAQVIGGDGNSLTIIGAVHRQVRTHLRQCGMGAKAAANLTAAVQAELTGAVSYPDLLHRARCLVTLY